MIAYAGICAVQGNKVVHHIDLSWNCARAGSDQVRFFTLEGDTLTIKTEPNKSPIDGREGVRILVWTKVRWRTTFCKHGWEDHMLRLGIFVIACMIATAPALAQSKATIDKLNARFADAFNKGDAATVASFYMPDAVVLPPGSEMVKGRSAIQSFWQGAAQQLGDIRLTAVDVKPLGTGAAREIGTFSLKSKSQPGQEIVGKYVVVWQKAGKSWKLGTDIWNANK